MKLLTGHVLDVSQTLPERSVQCIVTSPPYWGLRKYAGEQEVVWGGKEGCDHEWGPELPDPHKTGLSIGGNSEKIGGYLKETREGKTAGSFCSLCGAWRGAFGLEPSPALYIEHSMAILDALWRVLRDDGVLWWNLSDSYNGSGGAGGDYNPGGLKEGQPKYPGRKVAGLKPKDLCLIPFRFALAAQEQGWWVRSDIIWSKPNPMPESVRDRPTRSHEYIFMLTKRAKYFYDNVAVAVETNDTSRRAHNTRNARAVAEVAQGPSISSTLSEIREEEDRAAALLRERQGKGHHQEVSGDTQGDRGSRTGGSQTTGQHSIDGMRLDGSGVGEHQGSAGQPMRDLWGDEAANEGPHNPAQEERPTHSNEHPSTVPELQQQEERHIKRNLRSVWTFATQPYPEAHFATFPPELPRRCILASTKRGDVVLDPFSGSGTTIQVAEELGREGWGIDISKEYWALQEKRLAHLEGQMRIG